MSDLMTDGYLLNIARANWLPTTNEFLDAARDIEQEARAPLLARIKELQARMPMDIDAMVNRFLGWPLPESVLPDGCAMNRDYQHRCGTHLLNATEARQMFEYVLGVKEDGHGNTDA